MTTALILAGHGSHISPHTAGLVWRHVDRLRSMGVADEITAAFWKEMPAYYRVLETVTADDVTIVPLFTARGYFTQTVIPTEMALEGRLTRRGSRLIRYTTALNEHPYLGEVVQARVENAMSDFNLSASETAVAIIGHSTRRNPESRRATELQAQRLRETGIAAQVQDVYLDDSPEIAEIYTLTDRPNLIAVPYFLAAGSHTTIDVPDELSLEPGTNRGFVQGRQVFYTLPVGVDDDLLSVILALAAEVGAPLYSPSQNTPWNAFPSAGANALIEAVSAQGTLRFGELCLTVNKVSVWGDTDTPDEIKTPAALRDRIRENPFRSLATAVGLPRGWQVPINHPQQIHTVVETVYPGAVANWAVSQSGALPLCSLAQTTQRQTGMYRALESLTEAVQAEIVEQVCSGCVRHPLWFNHDKNGKLPCPEACNHWLSAALEKIAP
jgi:sirohydrochlorin cobaltochelatase